MILHHRISAQNTGVAWLIGTRKARTFAAFRAVSEAGYYFHNRLFPRALRKALHNPKKFSERGAFYTKPRRNRRGTQVYTVIGVNRSYLKGVFTGGDDVIKLLPGGEIKLDKHGNIPRKTFKRLLAIFKNKAIPSGGVRVGTKVLPSRALRLAQNKKLLFVGRGGKLHRIVTHSVDVDRKKYLDIEVLALRTLRYAHVRFWKIFNNRRRWNRI